MAIRANRSQAHLSLVVVQVKVLGVLLLPIPPPPLGRGAPLGPSRAEKNTPLSYERKWEEKKRAQNEKRRRGLWCEALTCCWWARWTERQTAAEGRSLVRSGPGRSSCPAGGGAERCGRSLPPSSRWLSLQKKKTAVRSPDSVSSISSNTMYVFFKACNRENSWYRTIRVVCPVSE